jgi:hypothetical protein
VIEAGIVQLIQADSAVSGLCPNGAGFLAQLPINQQLPSWSYTFVSDVPTYVFEGRDALTMRRLQIDCYASNGADAINLAHAIDAVLSAYHGTLPDSDRTIVSGCMRSNLIDFFDLESRSYRRLLEYKLWFYQ